MTGPVTYAALGATLLQMTTFQVRAGILPDADFDQPSRVLAHGLSPGLKDRLGVLYGTFTPAPLMSFLSPAELERAGKARSPEYHTLRGLPGRYQGYDVTGVMDFMHAELRQLATALGGHVTLAEDLRGEATARLLALGEAQQAVRRAVLRDGDTSGPVAARAEAERRFLSVFEGPGAGIVHQGGCPYRQGEAQVMDGHDPLDPARRARDLLPATMNRLGLNLYANRQTGARNLAALLFTASLLGRGLRDTELFPGAAFAANQDIELLDNLLMAADLLGAHTGKDAWAAERLRPVQSRTLHAVADANRRGLHLADAICLMLGANPAAGEEPGRELGNAGFSALRPYAHTLRLAGIAPEPFLPQNHFEAAALVQGAALALDQAARNVPHRLTAALGAAGIGGGYPAFRVQLSALAEAALAGGNSAAEAIGPLGEAAATAALLAGHGVIPAECGLAQALSHAAAYLADHPGPAVLPPPLPVQAQSPAQRAARP